VSTLKRTFMKITIPAFILLILTVISVSGCISARDTTAGILEGNVSIGPICPVERLDQPCITPPEAYEARKILVFGDEGKTLVKTVNIKGNGYYRTELNPGTYVVDINHIGIDRSADVPAIIAVRSGKTVILNITIDTGIR
jgi:hypothetical protein